MKNLNAKTAKTAKTQANGKLRFSGMVIEVEGDEADVRAVLQALSGQSESGVSRRTPKPAALEA